MTGLKRIRVALQGAEEQRACPSSKGRMIRIPLQILVKSEKRGWP